MPQQDPPVPFRPPSQRHGARRPDDSPTRASRNVNARPSTFISADDPSDEFRPQYCPHCQKNGSGDQTHGYLCDKCFAALSRNEWRKNAFVRAAQGFCKGPCNGKLSDEERRAQKYMCAKCAGNKERSLRDYVSMPAYNAQAKIDLQPAAQEYKDRMAMNLVAIGRCKNAKCGKVMQPDDRVVPNSQNPAERYVYCTECRNGIKSQYNFDRPERGLETTTTPVSKEVPRDDRLLHGSAPVAPYCPTLSTHDPFIAPPPTQSDPQEQPLGFSSSSPSDSRLVLEFDGSIEYSDAPSSAHHSDTPSSASFNVYEDEDGDHAMTGLEEAEQNSEEPSPEQFRIESVPDSRLGGISAVYTQEAVAWHIARFQASHPAATSNA